jgi:AcrR family transcriptional regulator
MAETTHTSREQLLETAARLFYEHGYRAIGVDAIVAESGIGKMTLYRHFSSKDELIVAYLNEADAQFWAWFEAAIRPHEGAPHDQIVALFESAARLASAPACHGCAFQNAAAEFPALDHPGHQVALAHKQAVRGRMRDLAAQAGAREPEVLADQLLLLMDGAWIAKRMFGRKNPAQSIAQAATVLLEAQLPPKNRRAKAK